MHGLIGRFRADPGQRDALTAILLESELGMPGCLSYVVAHDPADASAVWVTEVWDSEASHTASRLLPAMKSALSRAMPLIDGFDRHFITLPVGGLGLPRA